MDDQSFKYELDIDGELEEEALQATDPNAFYTSLRSALERLKALEAEMEDDSFSGVA